MDDGLAAIFRNTFEDNSQNLKVLQQNVPIFHSLKQSLVRYRPDIVFLAMGRMRYDTDDHKTELLNGLYSILTDTTIKQPRIAVQTKLSPKDPFLRKLAAMSIYDIFSSHDNHGQLDMTAVTNQLSKPANIANVAKYLSVDQPFNGLALNQDVVADNKSVTNDSLKQLESLKQTIHLLKADKKRLEQQVDLRAVPRQDYEDLLKRVTDIVNNGGNDQKTKDLFAKIIQNNQKLSNQVAELNTELNKRGDIAAINASQSGPSKQELSLQKQVQKLKQELQQAKLQPSSTGNSNNPARSARLPNSSNKNNKGVKHRPRSAHHKKKWKIIIPGLLILFLGISFLIHASMGMRHKVESRPSYSSLIKKGDYQKAASTYPDKGNEIENKMLGDPNVKDKESVNNEVAEFSNTDAIRFDSAYFSHDFKKAVSIYENSNSNSLLNLSAPRRTMLAYCYMKTGDIDNANDIAKPLNNKALKEKIDAYQKFQDANKTLEDKIKNGNLNDDDRAKAKEQIQQNKIAMKKL